MTDAVESRAVVFSRAVPGLRTFESRRFRLVLAIGLLLLGVVLNVWRLAVIDMADPGAVLDFQAYYHAADRMLDGSSPYALSQLESSGPAFCRDCYLYPPFLAQLLAPIALVPLEAAKVIWIAIGYSAAFASTWLATGIGGAGRSLERVLWCLAAVLLFTAVTSAAWVGNVGNLVALAVTMVALGGVAAGVGAGIGMLIKVSPGVFLPAAFVAGRDSRTALVLTLAFGVGILFLLAPQAWLDYPSVLRHVFADPSDSAVNLAPIHAASTWGWGSDATSFLRLASTMTGGICIVLSMWIARRPRGMPAAALLGTVAMLIIPGTLWYHYLAVLLPFAAMAWPRASGGTRGLLLASLVLVGFAPYVGEPPLLVYLSTALLLASAGWVMWPRPQAREP